MGLTIISAWFTVTVPFDKTSTTYHVGAVPAFAAIGLFGPASAIFLVAVFELTLWVSKQANNKNWSKRLLHLCFNVGNQVISILLGASLILFFRGIFPDESGLQLIVPWIIGAIALDLTNKIILTMILCLQTNFDQSFYEIWKEEGWSSQLIVLTYALGGGLLFFAATKFGIAGIMIFYLPILATMFAFKLYTQKVQQHFEQLEGMVKDRTNDLEMVNQDLADLNRQKDMFLTFLTHDLMTPISSIRFSGEHIKKDQQLNAVGREHAEIILRSQNSLENMVLNILDIEKMEIGTPLANDPDYVILQEVILSATDIVSAEAGYKDIKISINLVDEPAIVFADYQQIERIMFNLLTNAIKYTPISGSIGVNLNIENEDAVITVADTGYGISLEHQENVFDKYVQVKSAEGKAIGTGLGLAIVKELVNGLGGITELYSRPGEGSSFTVKIPIWKDEDERIFE